MDELRFKKLELVLKITGLISLISAGIWAFHTYSDTKEKEFYSKFWNKKMELYLETSSWASVMANATSEAEFEKARKDYYQLFYGQLSIVEGKSVKAALEKFTGFIPNRKVKKFPIEKLDNGAYELTLALKQDLGRSWKEPFHELDR